MVEPAIYKVEMRVSVCDVEGRPIRPTLTKNIASIEPMKVAAARAWASRNFNRLLKESGRDHLVFASFWAQQIRSPHSSLFGDLSGVNGREMRRTGVFEKW